jgi:hypothetical protein
MVVASSKNDQKLSVQINQTRFKSGMCQSISGMAKPKTIQVKLEQYVFNFKCQLKSFQ